MEYQVPQFIEVEDTIIGPLTLKQFIYLAGTIGLCVIFFAYLPTLVAILLSLPTAGFGWALIFYKVNNKPFIEVLEAGFNYLISKKLMLWKYTAPTGAEQQSAAAAAVATEKAAHPVRGTPRLTRGKLSELAWSLDVPAAAKPLSRTTS
jgi:hypothetical protein